MDTAQKQHIKLGNWWFPGGHVYGKNLATKQYMRSTRIKALEKDINPLEYKSGDVFEGSSATYELVGMRRRAFGEDSIK